MKKQTIRLFLTVFLLLSVGCTITNKYGEYKGKVVDSETKQPIEGAAVLAVYYVEQGSFAGSVTYYADAQETVTDKNGEFKIQSIRINKFKMLSGWDKNPSFRIFKPGYGCYPRHKDVKPMFVPNGTLPPDQYVVIELPDVKKESREERFWNATCSISPSVPNEKYKKLREFIQIEHKSIGY